MINFGIVENINIPEGDVNAISSEQTIMWQKQTEIKPLYPFVNGRHEFSNGGWIEITNGNHVHYYSNTNKGFYNLSNIAQNSTQNNNAASVNNKPIWFTIPNGSECVLTISNISPNHLNDSNFRLAEQSTSSIFFVGDTKNIRNVEVITSEDISVGCFFTYTNKVGEYEFDVTFTVNGERWI